MICKNTVYTNPECFPFYKYMSYIMSFILFQPRAVAGFRGTVRYASVNAHKNKVAVDAKCHICLQFVLILSFEPSHSLVS